MDGGALLARRSIGHVSVAPLETKPIVEEERISVVQLVERDPGRGRVCPLVHHCQSCGRSSPRPRAKVVGLKPNRRRPYAVDVSINGGDR